MKRLTCILACWLAVGGAPAAAQTDPDLCPGFSATAAQHEPLAAIRGPIDDAIHALDNARIELPSTVLATGKLTYLSLSIPLPDQLDKVRVLGYFELEGKACSIALVVNHIEAVKDDQGHRAGERTRIYFRTPDIEEFDDSLTAYRPVTLRIAAFAYENGQRGAPYFGRQLKLKTSSKLASTSASIAFAGVFYLLTALAVATVVGREAGLPVAGLGPRLSRLAPWNIIGDGAQTALSQLQMLVFTLIVATLLFYQWLRTGLLQELSTDLLYLIGISTLGAAGSQVTASMKKGLEPKIYQYVQRLGWFTAPAARAYKRPDPAELLMTNKRFDIYKFQMLVFSAVIAAYVIKSGADELDNLHISATLLTLMGISQGAYVGGHATSDSMTVLQDQLRGLQTLQERYRQSGDEQVRQALRRRFRMAAGRAGAMFNAMFAREVPDDMLDMPDDVDDAEASPQDEALAA